MIIKNLENWSELFNSEEFEKEYAYMGDDLGCNYSKDRTTFKVWSPVASKIKVNIYDKGQGDNLIESYDMSRQDKGVFAVPMAVP